MGKIRQGARYDRLVVIEYIGDPADRLLLVRCDCGRRFPVHLNALMFHQVRACPRCEKLGLVGPMDPSKEKIMPRSASAVDEKDRQRREAKKAEEAAMMAKWPPVDKSKFNDDWMFEPIKYNHSVFKKKKKETED